MRRTYRSKKDTGGALDHKDVLLTLDERSSAFDAFYIQKLKQTKRELSCVGSSTQYVATSQKGRKKKFVKRILKDVENTPVESMTRSTYLTPDKSIRVNKGQDLFDQLLHTPRLEVKKKDDLFDQLRTPRQTKTYGTKKPRKAKKYNYYSSESYETDKENESTNISTNITDIRAHKLIVEKDVPNSPKYQDESINKIVQNLSIFNNMKRTNDSSGSPVISFSNQVRKGTKPNQQLQSTVLDKSVLSSTPFKNIRTATSIYKLSPISNMSWKASPNYVTEENDQNLTDDLNSRGFKKPLPNVFDVDKIDVSNNSVLENDKTEQALNVENEEDKKESRNVESLDFISVLSDSSNASGINISLGGSKPSELFLGFSKVDQIQHENVKIDFSRLDKNESMNSMSCTTINCSELDLSLGGSKPSEPFFGFTIIDDKKSCSESNNSDNRQSSVLNVSKMATSNTSIDSQEAASLYDTCSSDKFAELSTEWDKEPLINVTRMDDAVFQDYLAKMTAYTSDLSGDEEMDENSESSDSQDHKFSYNNEHDQLENVHTLVNNENKIDEIEVVDSDDSNSNEDSKIISDISNSEIDDDTVSPQESESETSVDELDSNSNDDNEVRCFVNTRRKVTIKTPSNTSSSNDSSSVSSECNKTVLSNHNIIINSSNYKQASLNHRKGVTDTGNVHGHGIDMESDGVEEVKEVNTRISYVTMRKSSRRFSVEPNSPIKSPNYKQTSLNHMEGVIDVGNVHGNGIEMDSDGVEEVKEGNTRISYVTMRKSSRRYSVDPSSPECAIDKPAIVLQPGKKWERSLSIYRRMTMMNDHFDKSSLEDESMNCKGRKYRQSVISTMEMQEGSLHNESISSRRSTLVAKPCRSTISILKEPNNSRISVCNNTVYDDLKGFLSDDCDDTIVELTKLSIADSDHEVTVVEKLHEDRLTTARDYVLRRCNQTDAILFDECYPDTALKNCHKIGEGVYGEVFLWRARDGRARVMKIVPVAGTTKVNGENQKDFHEIISEIVIAMELSALRTPIAELERQFDEGNKDIDTLDLHAIQNATDIFNEVLAVRCVYGSYTSRLLDLWELYDECKGSENDNPAILPVDQQYIVLELANAGQDLESYQFNSAEQAHALFLQVAFGLAVGEEAFQFEHRDLHWGNVLIAPTEQKFATFVLRGRSHRVPRCGVAATIIDYSLSRLSLPLTSAGEAAALYNDLAGDDGLFDAVGDYQFEVYRLMRDKLGNDWKNFEPYTNIIWLHYTVDKMITALRYKRTNTKIHKHYIAKLKALKNRILSYGSAVQFVLTDNEY